MRVLWLCTLLIFIVFDVSISYAQGVQYLGSCGLPDSAKGIFVTDTIAYVANYSYGLNVINVADLTHPASIGHCDTPGNAQDVKVSGDYAYIADLEGGLRVADVSNPASPILVGHFDTTGACAISIDGAYAFVSFGWTGMYVFDISNPPNLNPYFNFMFRAENYTSYSQRQAHFLFLTASVISPRPGSRTPQSFLRSSLHALPLQSNGPRLLSHG